MLNLVYILGAGNSGSTLLSMVLGSHSKIVTIGEFSQFDKYVSQDLACSCQNSLSSCEFWSEIRRKLPVRDSGAIGIRPHLKTSQIMRAQRSVLCKDPFYPLTSQKNLDYYQIIAESSEKDIIIDASKDLTRFFYLYNCGQVRITPLFMHRDGRAYLDSMNKRRTKSFLPQLCAPGRNGFIRSYLRWARMNLTSWWLLKKLRCWDTTIHMSYEEFTREPKGALQMICEKLDIELEPRMMQYFEQVNHNIAGSPFRFTPSSIKSMNNWKKKLPLSVKLAFRFLGGNYLNKLLSKGINWV